MNSTSDILRRAYAASDPGCFPTCSDAKCDASSHCISEGPECFKCKPADSTSTSTPAPAPDTSSSSSSSSSSKSKESGKQKGSDKQKKSGDKSKKSDSKKSDDKGKKDDSTPPAPAAITPSSPAPTLEPPKPPPEGDAITRFFKPMYDSVCPKYKIPFMCQSPAYFGIGLIVIVFVIVSLLTAKRGGRRR